MKRTKISGKEVYGLTQRNDWPPIRKLPLPGPFFLLFFSFIFFVLLFLFSFSFIFGIFQTNDKHLRQIIVNIIHLVAGAGIRTRDLCHMSHRLLPLDQGF